MSLTHNFRNRAEGVDASFAQRNRLLALLPDALDIRIVGGQLGAVTERRQQVLAVRVERDVHLHRFRDAVVEGGVGADLRLGGGCRTGVVIAARIVGGAVVFYDQNIW